MQHREIFVIDDQHPEDIAMMQALYSRSPESVTKQLEKVQKAGSGKFMEQFYVGYGHRSIGDCGSTTLFVENVSMLAAKAIQDHPLYSGQEASTRYINMSTQPIMDPVGTPESAMIQKRWMDFYNAAMEPTIVHLKKRFPRGESDDEKKYEKAIKARAFDVLRSFLPAGCTTYVSWHTNLRQAADKLEMLRYHPLAELRECAEEMAMALKGRYANSFSHKRYPATERWLEQVGKEWTYDDPATCSEDVTCRSTIRQEDLDAVTPMLMMRPAFGRLPHFLDDLGQISFEFLMDFGSYRDLQRHRNGVCRMPLLSTRWGFQRWYLEQLPDDLRVRAQALIMEQASAIAALPVPDVDKQYYVAMGFNVPCRVARGLPGTLYLIELRSGKTVHPTMRKVAQDMATALAAVHPIFDPHPHIPVHADMDPNDWDVKRGGQDIVQKNV